jgi:type IV secretory pathway protease TraF
VTLVPALAPTAGAFGTPPPKLIRNASASVAVGLYAVRPAGLLDATELVAILPPEPVARFLSRGRYLPLGVPLIKRILALPGQRGGPVRHAR